MAELFEQGDLQTMVEEFKVMVMLVGKQAPDFVFLQY